MEVKCKTQHTLPLEELTEFQGNLKERDNVDVGKIIKSIRKHGFSFPFFVWNHDAINHVLDGHGRLLALKQMANEGENIPELPIVYVDCRDEADAKELLLKLNSQYGKMTVESVLEFIGDIDLDFEEIALPMGTIEFNFEQEIQEIKNNDEVPEEQETVISQPGEMYELGNSILMCGDSTNAEDVLHLINGKNISLTFTDPPYELDTQGGGVLKNSRRMKQIENNGVNHFDPLNLELYSDTNIYFHNKPLIKKYIELAEKNNKPYDLAFYKKKNVAPNYKGHLMTDCEYIAIIGNQDPNKGLEKELYSKCFIGTQGKDNSLSYSKPVELCEKYIKLYAKDSVLDLFGGSGSTLIAAEKLNKQCFMMEQNPAMCDVIRRRWTKWAKENGREVGSGGLE